MDGERGGGINFNRRLQLTVYPLPKSCRGNSNYSHNPYNKVTGCLSVCPGKVYKYFEGGYHHPPKRNLPQEKNYPPQFKKKLN